MNQPILYLLAGNGGAADWWLEAQPYFRHYETIPIELPGAGDHRLPAPASLSLAADALVKATKPGHSIFAVGLNALVVLHALQRHPGHFSHTVLFAPVGAYLWQRRLPRLMAWTPLRRVVQWVLGHYPQWIIGRFSKTRWSRSIYQRVASGYRRSRSFMTSWDWTHPNEALSLLEWVQDPVTLMWGEDDALIASQHAAAWSAILARASLHCRVMTGWGHYPWFDQPEAMAQVLEDVLLASGRLDTPQHTDWIRAHTKAGRLELAAMAGLVVPKRLRIVPQMTAWSEKIGAWLNLEGGDRWVIRSSSYTEDQADAANAGLSTTYLDQSSGEVVACTQRLFDAGVEEVLVQPFIQPWVSGIAFVRYLGAEIEWVEGHLSDIADGLLTPNRVMWSRMGPAWEAGTFDAPHGLNQEALWGFLQQVLHVFHYVHGDIEWAWDGHTLWLLQYRPIVDYGWQRHITTANIEEILPPQPSRLIEYAQQRAATSIPRIMAAWDSRVLNDNEPFTVRYAGASYINNDLFLARLKDWGIASSTYAQEVGGAVPEFSGSRTRWIQNIPVFLRMLMVSRQRITALSSQLQRYDAELDELIAQQASGQQLADWLTRYYVFVVQGNLCIASALASSGGSHLGRPPTVYQTLTIEAHRLPWETDPATPRPSAGRLSLQAFPSWPRLIRVAHALGMPGMRGYYTQVREWYRDNLMRIFYKLHHAMPMADRDYWFAPHPYPRQSLGGFWQHGGASDARSKGFMIYPGKVEGVLGKDILLVSSLDPGLYESYRLAKGVVAMMGGRLSHGSTLLRELHTPSAVIPEVDQAWLGKRVILDHGELRLQGVDE